MSHVACRSLAFPFAVARAADVPAEALALGSGHALSVLRNPETEISWADYAGVLRRLEDACGGAEALLQAAEAAAPSALSAALAELAAAFAHPGPYLELALAFYGEACVPGLVVELALADPPRLRVEPRGDREPCRPQLTLLLALLRRDPGLRRWPGVEVEMQPGATGADYVLSSAALPQAAAAPTPDPERAARALLSLAAEHVAVAGSRDGLSSGLARLAGELAVQREGEPRHRLLVENAQDLITEIDAQGRVLWASPSHRALLGRDPSEALGKAASRNIHPDDLSGVARGLADSSDAWSHRGHQFRIRHADGHWIWFEGTARGYRHADGTRRVVAVSRNISQRRTMEEELRSRSAALDAVHAIADSLYGVRDLDAVMYRALDAVASYTGIARTSLWLLSESRERFDAFVISPDVGHDEAVVKAGARLPVKGGLAELVIAERRLLVVEDLETDTRADSRLRDALLSQGLRCVVLIPLLFQGEPVGVLAQASPDATSFTPTHFTTLSTLGKAIASAVANARDLRTLIDDQAALRAALEHGAK